MVKIRPESIGKDNVSVALRGPCTLSGLAYFIIKYRSDILEGEIVASAK